MRNSSLVPLLTGVIPLLATAGLAQVKVVCTSPSVADITANVGGGHVEVDSLMRGPENVHRVISRPSYIMKMRNADLFVHRGLDGEPWVPLLIQGTRQPRLLYNGRDNVNVSFQVPLLEIPPPGTTRALGDLHVYGNPHYMLDPINGIRVAETVAAALERKDPDHAQDYRDNLAAYTTRLEELNDRLVEAMRPYRNTPVVTYHRSWSYFLKRYGLIKVAEVEPRPGLVPGPQSFANCIETMKATGTRIVIVETYNSKSDADFIAERVDNGVAVILAGEVNAKPGTETYEKLFEHNVQTLLDAFEEAGIPPSGR